VTRRVQEHPLVHVPNASGCAPGETVSVISTYGDECLRPIRPPDGRGDLYHQPAGDGAVCSKVADVNKSGLDYNRVNRAVGVSRRPRTGRCRGGSLSQRVLMVTIECR
jgi:hypothetical protein